MKHDNKRRVKGSVLFTVVSVMSLLIVFLMGTLVLAASANNRAHKSYSSSQTQYTARTAVDSILAAIGDTTTEGQAFADAINGLSNIGQSVSVDVEISDKSLGRVENATVTLVDKAYPVYDSTEQEWIECKKYAITAEVKIGGEVTTMTSYVLCDAPSDGPGSGGGGFVTNGGVSGANNHTSAVGGTYIGIGNYATKEYINENKYAPALSFDLTDKKYLTASGKSENVNDAYAFGNVYLMEAPFVIDGSAYMNSNSTILIPKKGTGVTIWGNLTFGNFVPDFKAVNISATDSDTLTAASDPYDFTDIPYLYVDGRINTYSQLTIGSKSFPMNVFCGYIEPSQFNVCNIYADIYCYDADKTTKLGATGSGGNLYRWASSVVNQGVTFSEFGGNFYSKGSLETLNMMSFAGDVAVEKNVTINGKTTIKGDLIVGGNLEINTNELNVTGNIYAKTVSGSFVEVGSVTEKTGVTKTTVTAPTLIHVKNAAVKVDETTTETLECWLKAEALSNAELSAALKDSGTFYDLEGFVLKDNTDAAAVDYYTAYFDHEFDAAADENVKDNGVYVYKDASGKELEESDLYEMSGMKYTGNGAKDVTQISSYLTGTATIFPEYAEKAVILGLESVSDSTPIEETKILQTVKEIGTTQLAPTNFPTKIPDNIDVSKKFTNSNIPAEITENCTISGTIDNKTITISPPENSVLWIKLQNTHLANGAKLIVNDVTYDGTNIKRYGEVNFFIDGTVTINDGKGGIITSSYDYLYNHPNKEIWILNGVNAYKDLPIHGTNRVKNTDPEFWNDFSTAPVEAPAPNINIYSSDEFTDDAKTISKNVLDLSNNPRTTAYIQAPYLTLKGTNFAQIQNTIYYNNAKIFDYGIAKYGNIGCVICFEAKLQNDWVNIYVPKENSVPPPVAAGVGVNAHTYQAVDYFAY